MHSNKLESLQVRPPDLKREFIICLVTMLLFATGGGGFLLLIVGFLEKRGAPVTEIGSVMSLLSVVEGIVCLLVGHFYRGKWTREIILSGLILNGAAAFVMSLQPTGWLVWGGAALCGAGFGVFTVIMYVAALQRRPSALSLGLAVGLYTACIAGGNGLGALIVGWMTDGYGFTVSFSFCVAAYAVGIVSTMTLSRKEIVQPQAQSAQTALQPDEGSAATSTWMLALLTAFLLSSVNMVFDILFPVYALRTGMSFTLLGSLSGMKMVLAAVVRPFIGAVMARISPSRLNNGSLAGLALGTVLIPVVGMGVGLMAVVALMGATFGSVRTTSATLVVQNETNPQIISRRISYYNTCLTLGQTISPWFIGLMADSIDVTTALILLPLGFLGLFEISSFLLPHLATRWDALKTRTNPR